jgi:diguanylate cyclase (GGDEF)-like protein/putative nucleotidyltransferase with HDIG domain
MAAIFLALPVFIYLGVAWEGDPLGFWLFTGLAALLGLVAIGRNLVLTLENTSLRERSLLDPLTDLYNHRYFHERLDAELRRADREASPLSIVCVDVDDFDKVNTAYGHAAGDRRLRSIADRLSDATRVTDVVCRIGGDEFAVIMPDTEPVEAYKACLRLQDAVGSDDDACPLPIGLSIGVAGAPEHGTAREELVQRADGALYWAKFHGRAQVVIYDPTLIIALGPEERIEMLEEESYVRMVQLLAAVVDARDPYTQEHSRSVASLAVRFCEAMGVEPERIEAIETAALLHDVGKIGVPDGTLLKPGALDDEEYSQIKEHPKLAARILSAIPRQEVLPWITSHHERWDGKGYPDGLSGETIPFEARVLALCDAYDAMTSRRTYRTAIEPEDALDELIDGAGSQFDPHLTAIFVALMRDAVRREGRRTADALAAAG